MLDIQEVELNLCDHNGSINKEDFSDMLDACHQNAFKAAGKAAAYVRLGFEFCENGLSYIKSEALEAKVELAEKKRMKTVFVLPPLHERSLDAYGHWIKHTLFQLPVREYVVNDMGTLYLLRKELGWQGAVTFGRLFDKSMREFRMDLSELMDLDKHASTLFQPDMLNNYYQKLAKKWNIQAFETDTLPDGILHVEDWTNLYQIHVHYPRIYLSRAAYCEYGRNDFCFTSGCGGACAEYGKRIGQNENRMIYKEGLSVFGIQQKPVTEAVTGKIRLIYSGDPQ